MMGIFGCFFAAVTAAVAIYEGVPPAGVGLIFLAFGLVYILNDTGRITKTMEKVPHAAPLEGALCEIENDLQKVSQELGAARSEIQFLSEQVDYLVKHVSSAGPMSPMRPARGQLITRQQPDTSTWRKKGRSDARDEGTNDAAE